MCQLRKIKWAGSSLNALKSMPDPVQQEIGYSLHEIQKGNMPTNTKILKGLDPGIMEIISRYNKNTYRAVYALKLAEEIYVLHVFQKKANKGIKTPKPDIDLIKYRLQSLRGLLNE
jgi:phage-related protein